LTAGGHTLNRIQSLARLYQIGYRSKTVDATIEKLVAMEQARLEMEAESLATHLRQFEQRYDLSSEEFHRRFQAGTMGDGIDMFEWSAFYQMQQSVEGQLKTLRS